MIEDNFFFSKLFFEDERFAFFEGGDSCTENSHASILLLEKKPHCAGNLNPLAESIISGFYAFKDLKKTKCQFIFIPYAQYSLGIDLRLLDFKSETRFFNDKQLNKLVKFKVPERLFVPTFTTFTSQKIAQTRIEERMISGVTYVQHIEPDKKSNLRQGTYLSSGVNVQRRQRNASADFSVTMHFSDSWEKLRSEICAEVAQDFFGVQRPKTPSAGGFFERRLLLLENKSGTKYEITEIFGNEINSSDTELTQEIDSSLWDHTVLNQESLRNCKLYFCPVVNFGCAVRKYGSRGYRFLILESGGILQSIDDLLQERGLQTRWIGGFDDVLLSSALNLSDAEASFGLIAFGCSQ